jgi:DNA polymerase-1
MRERLILIDSHSLVYRGFFAIPPLTTTKGELSNATFGFASIFLKAIEEIKPQHIAAAFDLPQPTFRHERDATYKATRKPMPDELRPQFERVKQLLERFGVPMYSLPGYEADDVIGALSRQADAAGLEAIIVSGDLDPLQLVTPNVKLFTTRMGFQNTVVYDEAKIFERYGLRPAQMIDYKALKGDTTDNIPGVPGVGEKTAAKLIAENGNLEGVFADLTRFTPKLRESLAANRDQSFRSREMATIVTDLPVTLEIDRTRWRGYDRSGVLDLFRDLEFRSLIPRLPPADANLAAPTATITTTARPGQLALGLEPEPVIAAPVDTTLIGATEAENVAALARTAGAIALHADVEIKRHPDLIGLGLAVGERAWYLPVAKVDGLPAAIAQVMADPSLRKTAHDAKTARLALRRAGAELRGVTMDTMLASYLVNASRRYHAIEDLSAERLKLEVPLLPVADRRDPHRVASLEERLVRAGAGAVAASRLGALFDEDLDRLGQRRLFEDIELPLVDVLVEMEEAGIAVDVAYLRSLGEEFAREVARIEREAYDSVGHEFPIASTKQLASLLFEELKLPRGRRTATGYSTDATVLEELRGAHPVVDRILEYREIEKLRSTYAEGLGALVDPDTRRVHTSFEQAVAATGRLSSKNPNLQNIPIRTPLGRRIRRAFVAGGAERALVAADYSQIELRILAHVSGDPELTKAFREGADVHRRTAAAGFGVAEDDVTREQRDVAKMLNFGIVYGMSDFGLAWRMKMPREEASRFIDEYFKRYAQVRRYVIETKAFAVEQGYVETLLGRRRYIPDMTSRNSAIRNAAERMAINMPIQGTAADIMKIAMRRVYERLAKGGLETRVLLQVHDELVAEVPNDEIDETAAILRDEMGGAYSLDVPLVVDVRTGANWDEMTRMQVRAAA